MSKQQLQQLLQALEQPAAKPHTGGKVAGQVSQTPGAIRQRQARAAKSAATPAQTTTVPVQPTATPTQTTAQPSMSQILKQRQAQGLGSYESVEFATLKTKLKEALAK
jgi:hypothetical protein